MLTFSCDHRESLIVNASKKSKVTRAMELSVDSPATEIMTSFRRAIAIKQIIAAPAKQHHQLLWDIRQSDVAKFHVYDMGRLFDTTHVDFITDLGANDLIARSNALQANFGLFLPHERTVFIARKFLTAIGTWIIIVWLAQQTDDTFLIHHFSHWGNIPWTWAGTSEIWRRKAACKSIITNLNEDQKEMRFSNGQFLISNFLLNLKGGVVTVTPALWSLNNAPAQPKAFHIPNPSVSVVKVNTTRIIVQPARADDGSGATQRPHTRRAHLRRRGNKIIQVRESKIHGGASPTIKVVKID